MAVDVAAWRVEVEVAVLTNEGASSCPRQIYEDIEGCVGNEVEYIYRGNQRGRVEFFGDLEIWICQRGETIGREQLC